ncbi:Tim44 domain-containing protein [Vogesella sp. LIG4]|uniref:Tim44 domain-containing protein n=1 Tax=Vogesella sp. LIG4 TaxID=1192162 RepID=UPI00081FC869|nr:TIM44-like domain-containing protein [Vogesella sp. LIG4]SCK14205.1 Predicted lipid-binding transport protein, Tim44 family [Vogesella sp. LIG4]
MNSRVKTTILAFSLITLLASSFADAARLGRGRSAGMQRAAPTQSYQPAPAPRAPMQPAPTPAPQKGSGIGGMVAAGAAGAAAGYLLGNAMHDGKAGNGQSGGFPWLFVIGGALAGLALLSFFRNRAAKQQRRDPAPQSGQPMYYQPQPAQGGIPPIGSGMQQYGSGTTPPPASLQRLPDGTEVPHFLRQAKATFLHLQNLNSLDSLEEIRKYMTPDLFQALKEDIAANTEPADFPQLDCQVVEATTEAGRMICSVRFSGQVSESVGSPTLPFSETWHYVKDDASNGKWLVAGIQQG